MRYFIIILLIGMFVSTVAAQDGGSNLSDDVFEITCSTGESVVGGVKFTFVNVNPDFQYRVSAIGIDGFDPVVAVIIAPGWGDCSDDYLDVSGSQISVSDTGVVEATTTDAQVNIYTGSGGNIDVVVGGYAGASGKFALVVEGLWIDPADDADGFLVSVPEIVQSETMGIYMIEELDSGLDPYLTAYYGSGLQGYTLDYNATEVFSWCDDAGTGECSAGDFTGGGIYMYDTYPYAATYVSAGITVTPNSTDRLLYVFSSSNAASIGRYGLVITGYAPGYLTEEAVEVETETEGETEVETESETETEFAAEFAPEDCSVVPAVFSEVSSEYDSRYPANALLDGNPASGWSSTADDTEPTFTMELGTPTDISSIVFNNYPAGGDEYADDAVEGIYVSVFDEEENEIVLVDDVAAQDSEYKYFYFDTITAETLYVTFTSNYGGEFFEASDIIVCE